MGWRARLPLAVLLIAMSSLFAFRGDPGVFDWDAEESRREELGVWNSAKNMALAENLSPEHNFRLFHRISQSGYDMYGSFPVGGPALIKIVGLPFGDDLYAKIYAARMLMLALLAGAAVLLHLSLSRIAPSRWIALAATMAAFWGHHVLFSADVISNEMSMELFGLALAFHGIVVFTQEGRFGQLAVKACAPLLIGWVVYAMLLPFIALGAGGEAVRALRAGGSVLGRARRAAGALVRSRFVLLGAMAAAVGVAVLGFNIVNEYQAYGGERPLSELRTARTALRRSAIGESYTGRVFENMEWGRFLPEQLGRVGKSSAPYALRGMVNALPSWRVASTADIQNMVVGALAIAACAWAIAVARGNRLALAVLALFGFCWALGMRQTAAFHDSNGIFFLGVPAVVALGALTRARETLGGRGVAVCGLAAAGLFALSALWMNEWKHDAEESAIQKELLEDFQAMRGITRGKSVFVVESDSELQLRDLAGGSRNIDYYLSGAVIGYKINGARADAADFAIAGRRVDGPGLLTPGNRRVFLYDRAARYDPRSEIFKRPALPVIKSELRRSRARTGETGNALWAGERYFGR